jgi:hypothetical protein
MLFANRACVDRVLRNLASPPADRSTAGYAIALPSAKISFAEARASSERMSFERMMLPELNRGSDGVVGRLHYCGEVVVFYFIAV